VLFIIRQQTQPDFIIVIMQSQQPWIIAQHAASPLVQVTQTPLSVISHLHMPIVRLQQQTIMPFIIMQQLHMPPASILHRFCTMPQAILSSQEQVIFIPPLHFSILSVQRGTMSQFMTPGIAVVVPAIGAPIPGILMPCIAIPARSIIKLDMKNSFHGRIIPPANTGTDPGPSTSGLIRRIIITNVQVATIISGENR